MKTRNYLLTVALVTVSIVSTYFATASTAQQNAHGFWQKIHRAAECDVWNMGKRDLRLRTFERSAESGKTQFVVGGVSTVIQK